MKAIIIDDEAVAAAALKRRIKWEKYDIDEVMMAQSMRQATEMMQAQHADLMLCDVEMPGGSGLELYEWVRTYSPETECIFVSCHPEYEYVRKALTMGSMDYVLKPVDYEEMDRILIQAKLRIEGRKNAQAYQSGAVVQSGKEAQSVRQTASQQTMSQEIWHERPKSDAIEASIEYIGKNLSLNMSISEIAQSAYLNPQYFMRLFKKEMGKSVLEYITWCRLDRAKQLLTGSSLPITEVALEAGYDNFSYFSKLFKRNIGMTPSEYRKQH